MPMIDVKELKKSFGALEVLKGVTFGVEKGEVVVVLGPSGSGKSTMLRCMNLLEDYEGGEIRIDGALIGYRTNPNGQRVACPEAENAKLRERVGMVFQSFNLFPHRTALDNVMMGPLRVRGTARREARTLALELLDKVGLADKADEYPIRLSGGQQQRVAIARALVGRPRLLFADEPTGNLDSETGAAVMGILAELGRDGLTIVLVTHAAEVAACAARTITLHDGCVASDRRGLQPVGTEAVTVREVPLP
jgi:polar amino acid transport system ATP-binding protein